MTIIIILIIALVFIFLFRQGNQSNKIDHLTNLVERMASQLAVLNHKLEKGTTIHEKQVREQEKSSSVVEDVSTNIPPALAPVPVVREKEVPSPAPQVAAITPTPPSPPPTVPLETSIEDYTPAREAEDAISWLKKENMEEFIGGHLANKIGIAVLVLGIAFFVKYAIDKDWINEVGRVSIGLFCGAALIGIAHRTRKKYRAFSSVLVGGGLSVLYFSIAFAFHQYHLLSHQAAFGIMVLTTVFAVVLALYYNRQELAIIALIGGFATPFLASTGNDNYIALFTYLAILCAGMTALSWFRKWPAINIISIIGSTIIFGGWLIDRAWMDSARVFPFRDALFFATLFFVLFMAMHILNNVRTRRPFAALDFLLIVATQLFYFLAGMTCLSNIDMSWKEGIFTLSMAAFNAILGLFFFRSKSMDRNFSWLMIGISITLFTLFALLQLNGHEMTLFWSLEAILLLWMGIRTKFKLLLTASINVQMIAVVSILFLWVSEYLFEYVEMPVMLNKVFVSSVVVGGTLYLRRYLLRKNGVDEFSNPTTSDYFKNQLYPVGAVVILFLAGLFEIMHQFSMAIPEAPVYMLYVQLYLVSVAALATRLSIGLKVRPFLLVFVNIATFLLVLLCARMNTDLHRFLVEKGMSYHFLANWLSIPFVLYNAGQLIRFFRDPEPVEWKEFQYMVSWVVSLGLLLFLAIILYQINLAIHLAAPLDTPRWETLYYKAQLSILGGLYGFLLIWLGLRHNYKPLRIISLLLFTITLVKLFFYDIRNIPPGGKIASFILLGVLLLLISFMYQRIKAIIMDEDKGK
ncbi:MAG: DUF2339 domain-containing protein [Chitinophagaceae bacterium]|nr:DUF2339 domain-containing protein [Chitinophagaceae bacterium]